MDTGNEETFITAAVEARESPTTHKCSPRGGEGKKTSRKHLSQGSVPGVLVKRRGSWPLPCSLPPTSGVLSPDPAHDGCLQSYPCRSVGGAGPTVSVGRWPQTRAAHGLAAAFLSFIRPSQKSLNVVGFQKPLATLPRNHICPLLSQLWGICHSCRVLP